MIKSETKTSNTHLPRLSPNQKSPPINKTDANSPKDQHNVHLFHEENESISPINESLIDTSNLIQQMDKLEEYIMSSNKSLQAHHQKLHNLTGESHNYDMEENTNSTLP